MSETSRPPHVLLLSTHTERIGGIERVTRVLARALVDLCGRERVGLLSVWQISDDEPSAILYRGRGTAGERVGLGSKLGFVLATLKHARRWRDDALVIACHPHLGSVALVARRLTGTPFAIWCHGEEVWGHLRSTVRRSLRGADIVFAPSAFTARRVEMTAGLAPGSVIVLPHCLPPELAPLLRLTRPRAPKQVLAVARLVVEHSYKGIDKLIAGWPRVLTQVRDAHLVIAGDGSDRPRLAALALATGVERSVKFVGAVGDADLERLYSGSAVFALPSRTSVDPPQGEGFGLVYIEAGAAGLAVVAERAGAIPEVVADGESGLLIEPGDIYGLSDALTRLLRDPELAERLGAEGRRRASTVFSYERFRDGVRDLLLLRLHPSP
jgi:phosphatidyl-myo-inositol dimannoside synthase